MNVHDELMSRVSRKKAVTFAEFMELALYWPQGGYYSSGQPFGRLGDYFTSPCVHPVFGTLLMRQFKEIWVGLGRPNPFLLVEIGGGNGLLASDVLRSAKEESPEFLECLRYVLIDPSSLRGVEDDLGVELRNHITRIISSVIPIHEFSGCVFCNELIDAFPVHRVVSQNGKLYEIYVSLDEHGNFTERVGLPSTPLLEARLSSLGVDLSEGYKTEINLRVTEWLGELASVFARGVFLLIDYGYDAGTFYSKERKQGTLQYYHNHAIVNDPYHFVGKQDMSAHVDFTTLQQTAQSNGFTILGSATQQHFLYNLGFSHFIDYLSRNNMYQTKHDVETLVDPEGLGGFLVVAMEKGVTNIKLTGFSEDDDQRDRIVPTGPFEYLTSSRNHLAAYP